MRSSFKERARLVWRYGLQPRSSAALTFAVGCVVAATVLRYAIGFLLVDPSTIIFATYYPAILIAALVGGAWAGALALAIAGVYAWWAFMSPQHAFVLLSTDQVIDLLVFCCSSSLVIAAAESYRRLARKFYEIEHSNKIVIDELNHRVKNKLATVQAILSHELRNNRDVWNTITARLAAISKTDDLILQSDGRGAELGEMLKVEFLPYIDTTSSRVEWIGTPLMLPPKLAVSLALILHELVTNAVKHGSLSVPDGCVKVSWKAERERVEITWVESGGPTIAIPTRQGFGSRLFGVALEPFHGRVERNFDADGLKCNISFVLPQDYVIPTFLNERGQPAAAAN